MTRALPAPDPWGRAGTLPGPRAERAGGKDGRVDFWVKPAQHPHFSIFEKLFLKPKEGGSQLVLPPGQAACAEPCRALVPAAISSWLEAGQSWGLPGCLTWACSGFPRFELNLPSSGFPCCC